MKDSYLDLECNVRHKAGNALVGGDRLRVVIFGPIALFGICKLTSRSAKYVKIFVNAHIAWLKYKILKNGKDINDLSIGFHSNNQTPEQ